MILFRSTFLVDREGKIVSIEKCDLPVGLNMAEQLRHVAALNMIHEHQGWKFMSCSHCQELG